MKTFADLARELTALEQVQADLAAIAARTDTDRRYELIQLRKALSQQIARVGQTGELIFGTDADPAVSQAYRDKLSRMRSAAAMHQANWPAVRLDEADDEYRRSALRVREANREFVAWTRDALARAGHRT
ncbi:hypothetical protein [Sphingomonas sp.]|uniref:hypothetical protein n=1 Tax=Sphingomonas sp. TaxID=28214 RepID=UPI003D6D64AC